MNEKSIKFNNSQFENSDLVKDQKYKNQTSTVVQTKIKITEDYKLIKNNYNQIKEIHKPKDAKLCEGLGRPIFKDRNSVCFEIRPVMQSDSSSDSESRSIPEINKNNPPNTSVDWFENKQDQNSSRIALQTQKTIIRSENDQNFKRNHKKFGSKRCTTKGCLSLNCKIAKEVIAKSRNKSTSSQSSSQTEFYTPTQNFKITKSKTATSTNRASFFSSPNRVESAITHKKNKIEVLKASKVNEIRQNSNKILSDSTKIQSKSISSSKKFFPVSVKHTQPLKHSPLGSSKQNKNKLKTPNTGDINTNNNTKQLNNSPFTGKTPLIRRKSNDKKKKESLKNREFKSKKTNFNSQQQNNNENIR